MEYRVAPYEYREGQGVLICDGPVIVATVKGTSYPTGSACAEDHARALVFAAAPELLAALQWAASVLDVEPADRPRGVFECDLMKVRRALAKAVQS